MEGKGVGLAKYAKIRGGSVTSAVDQHRASRTDDPAKTLRQPSWWSKARPMTLTFVLWSVYRRGGGSRQDSSVILCQVSARMSHLITEDRGGECPAVTPVLPTHVLVAVKCSYCGRETILQLRF